LKEYIHGFCNLDMPKFGIEEMRNGTQKVVEVARELFKLPPKAKK